MKHVFVLILIAIPFKRLHSQTEAETIKQLPSVAVGTGLLSFNGDTQGNGVKLGSFGRIKSGYNITVEQRFGKYLGASINCIYGKLADSERSKSRSANFQSKIIQTDLNFQIHLNNDLSLKPRDACSPYLFVGVGYLKFDPYGDRTDKNGIKYNYWSDGSIRSIEEGDMNAAYATVLRRDYTYETKLTDSSVNYTRATFTVPVGIGCNLKLLDNFSVNIGGTYYFTFTDWIDNITSGKTNDSYIFANISLQYSFTKRSKENINNSKVYENVDFSLLDKSDTDEDGIIDSDDRCQGTPKGVKVDLNGCPEDHDEDGVPDYRDKEPTTKKGEMVNEDGITMTSKMLAERQKKNDSQATDRSQVFNQNPSLAYLKNLDLKDPKKNATKLNIPAALKSADINKDGFITSNEMTATIFAFFEGSSDFTVEKLNDLVDFYFEQYK